MPAVAPRTPTRPGVDASADAPAPATAGTTGDDGGPHEINATGRRGGMPVALVLGAVGVVFGDIGTSPLYALRETFVARQHPFAPDEGSVLGVLSLITWALIVVVTVKYLLIVMRADNDGEGGILALTALVSPGGDDPSGGAPRRHDRRRLLVLVGLVGTALLYGDGLITPAISVLSAVEGTRIATPSLQPFVVPIAVVVLVGLFLVQRHGTESIGRVFGPVMVVWFAVLAVLGGSGIAHHPGVLAALSPGPAVGFLSGHGAAGFLVLGAVVLVVTGGEALYADMGHFGRRPIRIAWFALVLPALLANYYGQAAVVLDDPSALENPFYRLAPVALVTPLAVLATAATVVASQALISGAFSLTVQAMQLGYCPRLRVHHTSRSQAGQTYVPAVNAVLMAGCVALVVVFRSSSNLASAYGLAVAGTMAVTTILFAVVAGERLRWSRRTTVAVCGALLVVDLAFLGAGLAKIPDGGWLPLALAAAVFTVLTTWRSGQRVVRRRLAPTRLPLDDAVERLRAERPVRVPGTAVYLHREPGVTPSSLEALLDHQRAIHADVLVVSVETDRVPWVGDGHRAEVAERGEGVTAVRLHFGFAQTVDVPAALAAVAPDRVDVGTATFVLSGEALEVTDVPGLAPWREHLFAFLARNATPASRYFNLPPDRTMTVTIPVRL